MVKRGAGKIIFTASLLTFQGGITVPGYAAAKGGIGQLTKALANEWAGSGVQVNAIAPGYIDTPLLDILDEPMRQMILLQTPIGRLGTAREVAAVALYLAGDDSSFTVGQVISPNGGYDI